MCRSRAGLRARPPAVFSGQFGVLARFHRTRTDGSMVRDERVIVSEGFGAAWMDRMEVPTVRTVVVVMLLAAMLATDALLLIAAKAHSALHKPYRLPISPRARSLLVAAFAFVAVTAGTGFLVGYLAVTGDASQRVNAGGIWANVFGLSAVVVCFVTHRMIKDHIPPGTDDQIRAFRKYQRETSWLGPGSVLPDPPTAASPSPPGVADEPA